MKIKWPKECKECPECEGRGVVDKEDEEVLCGTCQGIGKITRVRTKEPSND